MISKATPADITAIANLVNSAYRGAASRQGWTTEADLLDGQRTDEAAIGETIATPHGGILKYEDAHSTLQGCVYVKKQGEELYLGMLTVAPNLQNKGIGKQLLKAVEAYAQEQQCAAVVMTVISVRHELIAWYERHGYQMTGQTEPFPHTDPRFGLPKQQLEFVVLKKRF